MIDDDDDDDDDDGAVLLLSLLLSLLLLLLSSSTLTLSSTLPFTDTNDTLTISYTVRASFVNSTRLPSSKSTNTRNVLDVASEMGESVAASVGRLIRVTLPVMDADTAAGSWMFTTPLPVTTLEEEEDDEVHNDDDDDDDDDDAVGMVHSASSTAPQVETAPNGTRALHALLVLS